MASIKQSTTAKTKEGGVCGKKKAHNRTFAKICADCTGQAGRIGG